MLTGSNETDTDDAGEGEPAKPKLTAKAVSIF
jgi:hypothetical protein